MSVTNTTTITYILYDEFLYANNTEIHTKDNKNHKIHKKLHFFFYLTDLISQLNYFNLKYQSRIAIFIQEYFSKPHINFVDCFCISSKEVILRLSLKCQDEIISRNTYQQYAGISVRWLNSKKKRNIK